MIGFNPTLVRLRPDPSDLLFVVPSLFQSHAGSIEAWPAHCSCLEKIGFNPTLVRLRLVGGLE